MTTMRTQTPRLALLIDADNVSARYLPIILDEVPKHGIATYRRIYGDFTDPQAAGWRELLLDNSIMPVQQFSNVKHKRDGEQAGKNATDSTLIIQAMDILYGGKVDGFVIVSSDSDFTRLAQRLRESNMIVVGMGCSHTSMSFRHACTAFVDIEKLYQIAEEEAASESSASGSAGEGRDGHAPERVGAVTAKQVENTIAGIVRDNDGKGEVTLLSDVGNGLRNKFPDFDVRSFGYTQLSKMIEDMSRFELAKSGTTCSVSIAGTGSLQNEVEAFVKDRLSKNKSGTMHLSKLAQEVYDQYPGFKLKDMGYVQFSQFADSIAGVKVLGKDRQLVKLAAMRG